MRIVPARNEEMGDRLMGVGEMGAESKKFETTQTSSDNMQRTLVELKVFFSFFWPKVELKIAIKLVYWGPTASLSEIGVEMNFFFYFFFRAGARERSKTDRSPS